jgi:ADP-ribosylglycohydrolase
MGAPLEGSLQSERQVTEMRPGGHHFHKKRPITDETLQTMAVAESLAACKGFNQKDHISRLFSVYENRPERYGPGPIIIL